jgi:hypothetical protein
MAAHGEEPGLEVFLALERRRVFRLLQTHEPDERVLHHIARPIEVIEEAASIAHERPFIAREQRGDVDGGHMVGSDGYTGGGEGFLEQDHESFEAGRCELILYFFIFIFIPSRAVDEDEDEEKEEELPAALPRFRAFRLRGTGVHAS